MNAKLGVRFGFVPFSIRSRPVFSILSSAKFESINSKRKNSGMMKALMCLTARIYQICYEKQFFLE